MTDTPKLPSPGENIALVYYDEDGSAVFLLAGDCRLIVVDERAPLDRVYEPTRKISIEAINKLISSDEIGHKEDDQHLAIESALLSRGRLN